MLLFLDKKKVKEHQEASTVKRPIYGQVDRFISWPKSGKVEEWFEQNLNESKLFYLKNDII